MHVKILIEGRAAAHILHNGRFYVEAPTTGTYEIQLTNSYFRRRLAVVTVDGVNVCDGAPGSYGGPGYVVDGGQTITISGWLRTDREVAAFEFKPRPESYAPQMGQGESNVGVIGVAWFDEKVLLNPTWIERLRVAPTYPSWPVVPVVPIVPTMPIWQQDQHQHWCITTNASTLSSSAPAPAASLPTPDVGLDVGTGYGAPVERYSTSTEFSRYENPVTVVTLQYATRERLVAWGVPVPPPSSTRPQPNPFPAVRVVAPPGWTR